MQVLLFQVSPSIEKQLMQRLRPHGISVRAVSQEAYTTPIGVLPPLGFAFAEPMLLMHGLSDSMVDTVLAELRAANIRIDLKAITTPTNLAWNAMQIYAELRRERESFLANRK